MAHQHPLGTRIGIIGAGASGLSAAHYLRQAGYEHVTVLEREQRVGGKCCSVTVDEHTYELGAVMATRHYAATRQLMAGVGVRGGPIEGFHCYDGRGRPLEMFARRQRPGLAWQVLRHYAWDTQVRYRHVNDPGLARLHPDLSQPFAQFARERSVPSLQRAFAPPFTAFGYGYLDEVPAAYVLKYMDLRMIEACVAPSQRMEWPGGVESLWARLAAEHDVRTGVTVRHVRRGERVTVDTDDGSLEVDALVLAGPLDGALGFLDATATERRLFSAVRTYDYLVLLCRITGLPDGSGFLPDNFLRRRAGHALLWYQRLQDDPVYTLYVLADGLPVDEVERICAEDLRSLGARLDEVLATRRWSYFPHVSAEDMAAGYYDELESLQGSRHTYFAGELMSFSTVEQCVRYSRDLVGRFFGPDPTTG